MTIRVAIVGCGQVARVSHLRGLRRGGDADVVAFASRSLRSAEGARDQWGSGDAGTDWHSAVSRDDVDAVHVCVPNALHAEVAARALEAGKHVLVEKPIATTLADAEALLALARGRVLGVAFDARSEPVMVELKRQLPSLGAVLEVRAELGHPGPQAWSPGASWFRDPALSGGGCLIDLGSHLFDALAWLVGPVQMVTRCTMRGPVEEEALVEVTCGDGVTATLALSWQQPAAVLAITVRGSEGILTGSGAGLHRDGVEVPVPALPVTGAAAAFARALARGSLPAADGRAGRDALAAVLAAYACAASGQAQEVL